MSSEANIIDAALCPALLDKAGSTRKANKDILQIFFSLQPFAYKWRTKGIGASWEARKNIQSAETYLPRSVISLY
jgi:hypothetical protein